MISVRRALVLSFVERYLLIIVSLVSSVLLARLLTPEQVGIYSVSVAVVGIAHVLRDFGIGSFLIQERNLGDDHIRTAFGVSLLIGGTLFVVVFLAAPLAGRFYREATMVETVRISSLNFLVLPFCSISLSLLRREMQFQRLLYVTLVATVLSAGITVALAYAGFGPNSMAIGAVVGNVATGMGAWLARGDRRLQLPHLRQWRSLMSFGGQSALASVVTTIAMDVNDLALGKVLGFAPVAMISRAQGLMNIFHRDLMGAIRNVAYPAFSASHRQGLDLESRYIAAVAAITSFAWPFYAFMGMFAPEVLRLMFGRQWDSAAPLVPWFCVGGAAAATYGLVSPLLTSQGRVDLASRIDLLLQPIRAVVSVLAVWLTRSMDAFAIVFALLSIASVPVHYWVKSRVQPTDTSSLARGLRLSFIVAALSSVAPAVIFVSATRTSGLIGGTALLTAALLCVFSWISAMLLTNHPLTTDPAVAKQLTRVRFLRRA